MVTDFATWIFLISHMKGYSDNRSLWRTIRQINHLFPNDSVTFGDAGCDRLQLPLPSPLETDSDEPEVDATDFVVNSLLLLRQMVQKVKKGEMLVLLLVEHGDVKAGKFRFLITTQPDKIDGKAFIKKRQLEASLKSCKGDVLVICNSCFSGHLVSEHWALLCSAAPEQSAYALAQSGSGYARGSAFTACMVAQVAQKHGLQVPLLRADPRTARPDLGSLPPSAPSHTFPAQLSTLKPLNMSLKKFVGRTQNIEKLVANFPNLFQTSGLKSTVSWTRILPIKFKAHEGLQGEPLPTLESQPPRLDPLLIKLATAMPNVERGLPGTRENVCRPSAAYCRASAISLSTPT